MWEDQGRQDRGWFGNGTSGNVPDPHPREATTKDLGRLIAGDAAQALPRRERRDFEQFTGQDSGKSLLEAMQARLRKPGPTPPTSPRPTSVGSSSAPA